MTDFFDINKSNIEKFNDGTSINAYEFLGAHLKDNGTEFAVWAPEADEVFVCGDFNGWDKSACPMEQKDGIWYAFVDGVYENTTYKYYITKGKKSVMKADPYAFYAQLRPDTGSVVKKTVPFCENEEYLNNVKNKPIFKSAVNIYEVHLGSFMKKEDDTFFTYREIAPKLTNYLLAMGYNYVEVMPLTEYPLDASWGYQTTGYYALTSRYGSPEDFRFFVRTLHDAGIGVIMDWVPGHFCRDAHGLMEFDTTPLYEYKNAAKADNPGWGTMNFDFTKPQVRSFLISNAIYWFKYYGIDGIRVDAVANILYSNFGKADNDKLKNEYGGFENIEGIDFIKQLNSTIHSETPYKIMFAEDSSDWPKVTKYPDQGGLGFDFKWNMGWMNDTLAYMKLDPIYRKFVHKNLTFSMCYAFNENFVLPISHDEVVHGKCSLVEKMPGYRVDKFAQARSFLVYMYGMPGKKLQFMGNEFAVPLEWRYYEQLEWDLLKYQEYSAMKYCSSDINHIYLSNRAMWENDCSWDGFKWCDAEDKDRSVLSFTRISDDKKNILVFICNFTPMEYRDFCVGVPVFDEYEELFNSDNAIYGGKNLLNRGVIIPRAEAVGEHPFSVKINLPAFGGIILKLYNDR